MSSGDGPMSSTDQQVVRWYTRARRFPQLIGRTPDGTRIPGGPYTITQVTAAGVLMFLGLKTTSLWARYGLVGNGLLLAGVVYGLVFLLGKIPLGSRSPLALGAGAWRAISAPSAGRYGGRPVRLRRPHHVQHRITVLVPPAAVAEPVGIAEAAPAVPPTAVAEPARDQPAPIAEPAAGGQHRAPAATASPRRARQRSTLGHRRRERTTSHQSALRPAPRPIPAPVAEQMAAPAPSTSVPSAPALSGVQALLAQNAASATSPTTSRSS